MNSLDGNNLGEEGARFLAEALRTNSTLRELKYENMRILKLNLNDGNVNSIRHNNIRDEGLRYIAEALQENRTLQILE